MFAVAHDNYQRRKIIRVVETASQVKAGTDSGPSTDYNGGTSQLIFRHRSQMTSYDITHF
jgi:hypothetical protein